MKNLPSLLVLSSLAAIAVGCSSGKSPKMAKEPVKSVGSDTAKAESIVTGKALVNPNGITNDVVAEVKSDFKAGEATSSCKAAIEKAKARLDKLAKLPAAQRTVETALLEFESALADYSNEVGLITFLGQVAADDKLRQEGIACENISNQFSTELSSRRDLYVVVSDTNIKPKSDWETRLFKKTVDAFEQSGMKLPDDQMKKFTELQGIISKNEIEFKKNLNEGNQPVEFSSGELVGLSKEVLDRSKKTSSGKITFNTNSADYKLFMENAVDPAARKKMMISYYNRAAATNVKLLEETIRLRSQAAQIMGKKSWADLKLAPYMAKNSDTALNFLNSLKEKLIEKNQADKELLLKAKKEIDPTAISVDAWDVDYLSSVIKKKELGVDNELIREYFPSETVVQGTFKIYSQLFGIQIQEVKSSKVWAEGVKFYEVSDLAEKKVLGRFYADLLPRPGKYQHAATFGLNFRTKMNDKTNLLPLSAIVANFSPPAGDKPSLLTHQEVQTFFHEFGHLMHQILTKATFASLSGTRVARDFVEAPSQLFENYVWSPQILAILSGHYKDTSKKLPAELLEKLVASRKFQIGNQYARQLLLALFDQTIHIQTGAVDTSKLYSEMSQAILGYAPPAGTNYPSGFGHLMGGYDASYYGYLWSKVFAEDMFSTFAASDLMNAETGKKFRTAILEQGDRKDANELIKDFLGRESNKDAFLKSIGI